MPPKKTTTVVASRKRGREEAVQPAPPPPAKQKPGKVEDVSAMAKHPPLVKKCLQLGIEQLSIAGGRNGELPGRESQLQAVLEFLTEKTSNSTLQLFGMPGTGKTAVVKQALRQLEIPHSALFLNGYVMQRPSEAFISLWRHMCQHRAGIADPPPITAETAQAQLEKRFHGKVAWTAGVGATGNERHGMTTGAPKPKANADIPLCVIVVDEMDKCCDKNGKVLFKLVDWVDQKGSHCKLITMANAMQLPEQVDQKTRSRLNTTERVTFPPYTSLQLKEILQQRVGHLKPPLFSPTAMDVVCTQISLYNGDVRRLLQTTSAAVHSVLCHSDPISVADANKKGIVQVIHTQSVMRNVLLDTFQNFVHHLRSPLPLLIMAAITRQTIVLNSNGQNPAIPLGTLYNLVGSVFDRFEDNVTGRPEGLADPLPFTAFVSAVDTLREVQFIDLLTGTNEDDLAVATHLRSRGQEVFWTQSDLHVALAQPVAQAEAYLTLHELHGEMLAKVLR